MTQIQTERLTLRPLQLADAHRIGQLLRDWDLARNVSMTPFPEPEICAEGYILILEARRDLGLDHVFAVDLAEEGLIGVAGAHVRGASEVEINYWLGRPYWGHGYATEVGRALAQFAKALDKGAVTAGHFIDNPASGRVLEKAGFGYTGAIKPRYALARRENVPMRVMQLEHAA